MNEDKATSAVERYARRDTTDISVEEREAKGPDGKEYQAYSAISANRRPELMLEFRFVNRNSIALPYAYLIAIYWNPTEGIHLRYTGDRTVLLQGRNLDELRFGLVKHHVGWVQEIDVLQSKRLDASTPVIESIQIEGTEQQWPTANRTENR